MSTNVGHSSVSIRLVPWEKIFCLCLIPWLLLDPKGCS